MGSLTILSKACNSAAVMSSESLPVFYMSGFSIPGLLVDKLDKAFKILRKNQLQVVPKTDRLEIATTGADQVLKIANLFRRHGIEWEFTDFVDQVYQG